MRVFDIKSKLRNRLSLTKAEKLVYIFSNIRLLRRVRNDPRWCPDLDFDTGTSGEDAPPDEQRRRRPRTDGDYDFADERIATPNL